VCVYIWCISNESDFSTAPHPCGAKVSFPPTGHDSADGGEPDRQEGGGRGTAGKGRGHRPAKHEGRDGADVGEPEGREEGGRDAAGEEGEGIDLQDKNAKRR